GADLQRPGQPRPQLMISGLKAQHQNRVRPVTAPRQQRLIMAQQAAVSRMKPGLRQFPGGIHGVGEPGEIHRRAGPEPRPRLNTPRAPSEPQNSRSADGPAPEAGSRLVSITPRGVTTRTDSTNSSIWVCNVAKWPPERVAIHPPSVDHSKDCGKCRNVRPCG